jgi:cytochrome P450
MGVPHEDQDFFLDCANARFFHTRDPKAAVAAGVQLGDYFHALIERRLREQQAGEASDDIVSELVRDHVAPGELTVPEAVVLLRNILVNGQDTTASMIALGTLALLTNHEQRDLLLAEPERAGDCVNEMMRFFTNAHFQAPRTALEDVEIAGQLIRKGEGVLASIVAANRDPEVFEDPDVLRIERDASRHLGFGSGIHSCLGRPVARLELELVFPLLFSAVPDLRLAVPVEEVRSTANQAQALGLLELPVAWGPGR